MNAIQSLNAINTYADVSRNGRFYFSDINRVVNDNIQAFIDETLGDPEMRIPNNFQLTQSIRNNLRTLIKTAVISPTNGTVVTNKYYSITPSHINLPVDYYDFVTLNNLIDGFTDYSRPTTYNEKGPLFKDSYRHPTNIKTYFNEDATGLLIYRGVGGTFTSSTLEYIRTPVDFTIGTEANLINAGVGVLNNGLSYIATEISVQNSITYSIGTMFTAVGTNLTSGQVILTSLVSPIDLPEKVHSDICKSVAQTLLLISGNLPQSQALDQEITKS